MKYLEGTAMQGLILEPDTKKGIECYINSDVSRRCNQDKSTDSGSVLFITSYVITYGNYPIIWASQIKT